MANAKEIELLLKARNLASRPLGEMANSVRALKDRLEALVPAAERGEVSLNELEGISKKLEQALQGLRADAALVESFKTLSAELEQQQQKLAAVKQRADEAQLALSRVASPTREMTKEATASAKALAGQERETARLVRQLDTLGKRAVAAGLDFRDLAGAEQSIARVVAQAGPAFERVNGLIDEHASRARASAEAARALTAAQKAANAETAAGRLRSDLTQATGTARDNARIEREYQAFKAVQDAEYQLRVQQDARLRQLDEARRVRLTQEDNARIAQAIKTQKAVEAAEAGSPARVAAARQYEQFWIDSMRAREVQAGILRMRVADLSEEERRLAGATQGTAGAARTSAAAAQANATTVRSLSDAYRQASVAVRGAAQAFSLAEIGERRSLSLMQRLRGEVLSVTASFVGLYGAIQSIGGILDVINRQATIKNTFDVAFGARAGEQLAFVEKEADRLGFRFLDLAEKYGKFAVAAQSTGTSVEETQFIFQSFVEVSRSLNLSTERTGFLFLALEQIMSKGKFAMQELRQQLGDQLPGALGTLSEALGIPQAELTKMIETTGLSSKYLLNFANEYRTKFAGALANSLDTPQAALGRFQTQLDNIRIQIANSGFLEEFKNLLAELTTFFKSDDGQRFSGGLSVILTTVVKGLILVVRHAKLLGSVLAGVFVARAALDFYLTLEKYKKVLPFLAGAFNTFRAAMLSVNTTMLALIVTSRALAASFAVGMAGIAGAGGFYLGKWLNDSFSAVRQFGVLLVSTFVVIVGTIRDLFVGLYETIFNGEAFFANVERKFKARLAVLKDQYVAAGEDREQAAAPAPAELPSSAGNDAAVQAAILANEEELAKLRSTAALKASQELNDKLAALRSESLRKDAATVEEYRIALQEQFAELYREIEEYGKQYGAGEAARLKRQLDAIVELRVAQAGDRFSIEKAKRDEADINQLLQERNALIANAKKLKDVNGEASTSAEVARLSAEYNGQIEPKIKALLDYIASLPEAAQRSLRVMASDMEALRRVGLVDENDNSVIAAIRLEFERIRDLTQSRTNALQLQKALLSASLITEKEYEAAVAEVNNRYAEIVPRADALLQAIAGAKDLTEAQRQALADVVIALEEIRATTGAIDPFAARVKQHFESWAGGLAEVIVRAGEVAAETRSLSGGWQELRRGMLAFFADFLRQIALAIAKAAILKALTDAYKNSGGGGIYGAIIDGVVGAMSNHTGGIAGRNGKPRAAMASWFKNAPRYHRGTIVGLKPNEVPSILERNEEVLTEKDPRHSFNGGGRGLDGLVLKVVNTVDSGSVVEQGAQSSAGERAILNVIRANASSLKSVFA